MTTTGARRVVDPVQDNEGQAANHEDDSYYEEDGRLRRESKTCSGMFGDAKQGFY